MDIAKIKQLFNEYFINTLKNDYVNYQGRANRPMYWYFVLFNLIVSIIISIIAGITGLHILSSLYSLAVFCPGVCLGIRRMHDLGKAGWCGFWLPSTTFISSASKAKIKTMLTANLSNKPRRIL